MTKKLTLLIFTSLFFMILGSMVITSCTKEGPEGLPGQDGADGRDGTETCTSCHNFSEVLLAKVDQHSNSAHASGANINRNGASCSQCHTSQGFRTFIEDGTLAAVPEPTAINCRTCHPIHETYTVADYMVRTNDAVDLIVGETYDYGNSNLCVNCHQARPVNPMPMVGGDAVDITNARWGPHYATQGNIVAGTGAYEVSGSMTYANSPHANVINDGCVTCHMGTPVGYMAGGHQMSMKYGANSYNYNSCSACHTDASALTALMNENRTEIKGLMEQLETILLEGGLMNPNGLLPTPLSVSANEAGAILNYKLVYGDKSYGAHNYKYVKALLTNTIESFN